MRRSNNKILFIVLIVLIGGFVLTRVFRAPSLERNIEENVLSVDTSKVSAINISPATEGAAEIKLVRSGKAWQIQQDQRRAAAEINQLKTALGSISEIHADRILTRNKEKWATYNVDTTGTNVKVFIGPDSHTEFWVGKTSGGGTALRVEGEDDVYEVEEMLDRNFNKNFNAWRDKSFLKVEPDNISKIAFQYPGDSSFVVQQSAGKWNIEGLPADSAKVQTYLNRFRSRTLSDFADNFTASTKPTHSLELSNDSATAIRVGGWKVQGNKWVLTSSIQDSVYFSSEDSTLVNNLFSSKKWFLSK